MAKAAFGEYGAFHANKGQVRYQLNNKLVSKDKVPPEVVEYLNKQLGHEDAPKTKKFAPPTEEEKARLRAESLHVPEHLRKEESQPETPPSQPMEETTVQEPNKPVRPIEPSIEPTEESTAVVEEVENQWV